MPLTDSQLESYRLEAEAAGIAVAPVIAYSGAWRYGVWDYSGPDEILRVAWEESYEDAIKAAVKAARAKGKSPPAP